MYFYIRSKDSKTSKSGTPYYVGKGKNNRAFDKHDNIGIPKDRSKIILVEQNLTELQAFILERYYIRWFGRKDNGTGILRNKTEGGEGSSGHIVSNEERKRRSKRAKEMQNLINTKARRENARIRMKENNPMKISKVVTKMKESSAKNKKKKIWTEERKINARISKLGDKNPHYNNPNASKHLNENKEKCIFCGIITTKGNIKRWHNDRCKNKG